MKKILPFIFICMILFGISVEAFAAGTPVKVDMPASFKVTEKLESVNLSWKKVSSANGYVISRSTEKDKWQRIATIRNNKTVKYVDESAADDVLYYYSIKAFKKSSNKTYYSKKSNIIPVFFGVNFYLSTYLDSVLLKWQQVNEASGYEIYFSEDSKNYKRIKTITNKKTTSYKKTNLNTKSKKYSFFLKVYKKVRNKKVYIYQSDNLYSNDLTAHINGSADKSKSSFKTYNVQGKKAYVAYTVPITKEDKKIFTDYEKANFTKDMSPCDKALNTLMFIHSKVKYATGALYSQIDGCSYANAIFNKKMGQCAQYNGAMIEYLAYLGFNTKLIWGYRGKSIDNRWQHFWGQVKLNNGKTYVIETGNYENDGSWYHFFTPYSQTKKYLKCGKYVSGIKA